MKYGERLKEIAIKAGFSAEKLGDAIGLSRQNISAVYKDKDDTDRKLLLDNHFKAAAVLNICPIELYTGVPKKQSTSASSFSSDARNLATLFDMIPESLLIERMEVSAELMRILVPFVQQLNAQTAQQLQGQRTLSL